MKWENYPPADNSWEPATNLDCDELIVAFDEKQVCEILGAKKAENGNIIYLVKYKDGFPNRMFPSSEALAKWPSLVLEYLERQIHMVSTPRTVKFSQQIRESNELGDPIRATCKS